MKSFIFTILLLLGTAHAGDRNLAIKMICMPMNPKPEFYNCIETLRYHTYFESQSLAVCASMSLNADKIFCMESVAEITFEKAETNLCASKTSDVDKQDCLNNSGKEYQP